MKIEVWSDFVCPFCYIGKVRLEKAVEQFPHKAEVEIEYKSFELDPHAPSHSTKSIHESLAEKYGMSIAQAEQNAAQISQQAAEEGLTFNFQEMKPTNTFAAHRLAKLAKEKGREQEIVDQLLFAYFTESKNVGDEQTLAHIAAESGLDREEALRVLHNKDDYASAVREDLKMAQQYGITGVPFFVINQKYAISGAQPTETFRRTLEKVWEEESAKPKLQPLDQANGAACSDGSCDAPLED